MEFQEAVASSDVIEIQWSDYQGILGATQYGVPTVVVMHDVLTQKFERIRDGASTVFGKLAHAIRLEIVRVTERRWLGRANLAIVFCEKDQDHALTLRRDKPVCVIHPPFDQDVHEQQSTRKRFRALFVGAMSRPENRDAVDWLASEIWPRVLSRVPEAELLVVGGGAQEDSITRWEQAGLTVTGFVPELAPFYRESTVFVAPLRYGAGVKFKVVEALLAGLPVVTTHVGAEGIAEGISGAFVRVSDREDDLADGIIDALTGQFDTRSIETTRAKMIERHSPERFRKALGDIYQDLWLAR